MSKIEIVKKGITKLNVDVVVNAANKHLSAGDGVCGAVFKDAGYYELQKACNEIGFCHTGSAVITPGFNLKAKYIVHAVGPVWKGGNADEPKKLYGCYRKSLELAKEYDCHSIAFPVISSGIFGYPKEKAWKKAIQACQDFIKENTDYDIDIYFGVLTDENLALGKKVLAGLNQKTNDPISDAAPVDPQETERILVCQKYIPILQMIEWDENLKNWCKSYNKKSFHEENNGLRQMLDVLFNQAYDSEVVKPGYDQIIEEANFDQTLMLNPTDEFISGLTKQQILACITWHYRRDHFCNGSLWEDSIADGALLKLMMAYVGWKKF